MREPETPTHDYVNDVYVYHVKEKKLIRREKRPTRTYLRHGNHLLSVR